MSFVHVYFLRKFLGIKSREWKEERNENHHETSSSFMNIEKEFSEPREQRIFPFMNSLFPPLLLSFELNKIIVPREWMDHVNLSGGTFVAYENNSYVHSSMAESGNYDDSCGWLIYFSFVSVFCGLIELRLGKEIKSSRGES